MTMLLSILVLLLGSSTPCAAEQNIAIVVAKDAAKSLLRARFDHRTLKRIYRRQQLLWPNGQRAMPLNLSADNPLRHAFTRTLFHRSMEEMASYWNEAYFDGLSPPHVVDSQEAVIRFVTRYPGAIGYVASCKADDRVKVLMELTPDKPLPDSVCDATPEH